MTIADTERDGFKFTFDDSLTAAFKTGFTATLPGMALSIFALSSLTTHTLAADFNTGFAASFSGFFTGLTGFAIFSFLAGLTAGFTGAVAFFTGMDFLAGANFFTGFDAFATAFFLAWDG